MKDNVVKVADILREQEVRIGIQKSNTKLPGNENDYGNWEVEVVEIMNNVQLQIKWGISEDWITQREKANLLMQNELYSLEYLFPVHI